MLREPDRNSLIYAQLPQVDDAWIAGVDEVLSPAQERWRRDPVGWATSRGIELWSKQREILEAVRDHKNVAVRSCHEIGKSFTAGLTVCWWIDTHPAGDAKAVTTAPTDKQVKAILWNEINRQHSRLKLPGRTNLDEWYLGKEMVAFGRKPSDHDPSAFQGIHALYFLIVLDEACGVPKSIWDAASTLGANKNSRFLVIGNPDDEHTEFAACLGSPDWHNIRVSYRDTPNFTGEPVSERLRDLLIHPDWVAERRRKWGEGSALFTSKCEGEFPRGTSPFIVIPVTWLERAKKIEQPPSRPVVAGLDIGAGGDKTVVRLRYGTKLGPSFSFQDSDPVRSVGLVSRLLREHRVERVNYDSIGVGWAVGGALREASSKHNTTGVTTHDAEVVGVNFGESPTPGTESLYLNKRAEAYWRLRDLVRLDQVDMSALDDETLQDLSTPVYETLDSKGKIKIEPKEDIIKKLGRSPDEGDAVVYAFYEVATEGSLSAGAVDVAQLDITRQVSPNDWQGITSQMGSGGFRATDAAEVSLFTRY